MTGGDVPRWRRYLRFIRPDPASDVDDELAFHVAMRAERNVALGMSPEEAHADALRRFGDVTRWRRALVEHDRQREASRTRREIFTDVLQDVAYAARSLGRAPGTTIAIVLTLALGLGVNMALFSFLDVVFLRAPAAVRAPAEVRRVWTEIQFRTGPQFWSGFAYQEYAAVRDALGRAATTAIYRVPSDRWLRTGDRETRAAVSIAEWSFFPLLGIRPTLGRFYTVAEDAPGAGERLAVLSHAFWQRELGADPDVVGRTVHINSEPYTVIGVAAESFSGVELDATDLWIPLSALSSRGQMPWWRDHAVNGFQILLRPQEGFSESALIERIETGLRSEEALQSPRDSANAVALGSIIRSQGPGRREQEVNIAMRLAGVTTVVLLIACANVINLLLARALRRRREIAVRLAMGISRLRLARLLLAETTLLALVAGAAAILAAYWGGTVLRALLLPDVDFADATLDGRVVAVAFTLALVAGLLTGMLPVLQSVRTALTAALKAGSGASFSQGASRVRNGLVVAQAALSVVLLVGATLFVSSLHQVRGLRTGYDADRLVFASVAFDTRDSARDARLPDALRALAQRVRATPGVHHVALTRMAPTRGFSSATFDPDVDTTRHRKPFATFTLVSPEFFEATGTRLLRGESFPRVSGASMPAVVVINDAFARAQWPGMDPLGRCLRFPPESECYRVIGIVETAMFNKLIEEPHAQYYLPVDNPPAEAGKWFGTMIVAAEPGGHAPVIASLRRMLVETFPSGRPAITTMQQVLEPEYRPWRLGAALFTAFGVLALVVAALGVYSTIAYAVAQRTQEFGVRTALGARTRDILAQVLGTSVRIVGVGIGVGVVLALASGRFIAALLYGIEPTDPRVLAIGGIILLVVAILAALGPAWRAARVSPAVALRAD